MKVTLAAVCSINGKITRGDETDIQKWTSPEDASHFKQLKAAYSLLVMGRGTYEAMRPALQLSADTLRVVLTKHPENYAAETVTGQLEFSNELPRVLVKRLEQNYSEMLLLGGGTINSLFLAAGLVDEIYLTLEPVLFGTGTALANGHELDTQLSLMGIKKLNTHGTLLLHYKVKEKL